MNKTLMLAVTLLFFSVANAQSIVLPGKPTESERTAAEELSRHLEKAIGKPVPVIREGTRGTLPFLYVGATDFARKKGILTKQFEPEEWLLQACGKDALILAGGEPRGILYASWEFLERFFNILWPDEETVYIPENQKLQWKGDLKLSGKPSFEVRCIFVMLKELGKRDARHIYLARNRMNHFLDEEHVLGNSRKYGIRRMFGSPRSVHTFMDYMKDWGEEQLQCYSMNKEGKHVRPVNHLHGQICMSNPETVRLFVKKLREYIALDRSRGDFVKYYLISSNDNSDECQCPECQGGKKKYDSWGGVQVRFINKIAEAVEKDYPEIKIITNAYHSASIPPKNIKIHKNVIVDLPLMGAEFEGVQTRDTMRSVKRHPNNRRDRGIYEDWAALAPVAMWDYWILYKNNGLAVYHQAMAENLRYYYHDLGSRIIVAECEYPMTTMFGPLRVWLGFRLMYNINEDFDAATRRFMNAYYGTKAAPEMMALLQFIQKCNDSVSYKLGTMSLGGRPDLTPEFFKKADGYISRALAAADTPEQKKHIRKERFVLDYNNLCKFRNQANPDMKAFQKRILEDYQLNAPLYERKKEIEKFIAGYRDFCLGLAVKVKPVRGFENYKVLHDLAWPLLKQRVPAKTKVVDMPDAASGKALQIKDFNKYSGFTFGYRDPMNKKNGKTKNIPLTQLPQDEQFHYYSLGEVELSPQCYIYVHPSWHIQQSLGECFSATLQEDNRCEIFLSLKAEGPAYVKGSKKENALTLDRVLLVKPLKK